MLLVNLNKSKIMKQILLLTDFSKNSINAIHYALHLFKAYECNFYFLHVENSKAYISDDLVMGGGQSLYDSVLKKSKNKLIKLVNGIEKKFESDNFKFQSLVDYDGLSEAINQVVASKAIELVVMGSNGVTGASETVFGSNTINVIRNVDCPTLVIPEGFPYKKPTELLLPLDLDDALHSKAFSALLNFTKPFSDRIHLLRINPKAELAQRRDLDTNYINGFDKALNYVYHAIEDVPMEFAVSCYTQTHPIDLMALLVQKESFFERFFTGSSTTKISNQLRVPLLVFHS